MGPGSLVGICVERSLEMVVGLLGILKSGGAYVPLDLSYPPERLEFMMGDTGVSVVLTEPEQAARLPLPGVKRILLDGGRASERLEEESNPRVPVGADAVAYVMYTSGSTGRPKGVEVCHRGIVRLLFGVEYVELDETRTIMQMAPLSFDASTFELWGALLHGGRSVLFAERVPSIEGLRRVLKEEGVDTLWLTSALFNTVIDERPRRCPG